MKPIGFWGWVLRIAAVGYPLALLAIVLAFRFIGERWWVTVAALYLPRLPFGAPLPVLVLALAWAGPRRLLVTQLVALVLLLFPLLGMSFSLGHRRADGVRQLRVLSFNVDGAAFGLEGILQVVHDANPDIVLFQEASIDDTATLASRLPGYHAQGSGQFFVASRYPIVETFEPPKIPYGGVLRSSRFVRYRLAGPQGLIQVYNIHPPSPRDGLEELHGEGLREEITTGHILANAAAMRILTSVAGLRAAQVCAVAADANSSPYPVVIAGDTNLPGLSRALAQCLGRFQDGFRAVGNGFGYTFPATKHGPWMRIDRVLVDDRLHFVHFAVAPVRASDHLPVIADLELVPPATESK